MPIHKISKRRLLQKQRNRQIVTWTKWLAVFLSLALLVTTAGIMLRSRQTWAREGGPVPAALEAKNVLRAR